VSVTSARIAGWGGLALSFALSAALYSRLPVVVPASFAWLGAAAGTVARLCTAFAVPVTSLVAYVITCAVLRRQRAAAALEIVPLAKVAVFLALHVIMLRARFDPALPVRRLILICASAFICVLGNYLGKIRRNRWVGIRTPWTLANDEVWLRTHHFGARLYFLAGALSLCALTAGAPDQLGVALLFSASLASVLYSYVVARRLAG
jgi:uncharacterized membrane protein